MPDQISTATVSFKSNGDIANGYLAYPTDKVQSPAIIVIQEWWGVDEHIKDITERLARLGFAALAPDLYHGQITSEPDEARKLAMSLEYDKAAKEIDGAAHWLTQQTFAAGPHFGCIGFCMGGGLALTTAIRNDSVAATIVYYGGLPNPASKLESIHSPVLAFYGEGESERAIQLQETLVNHNKPIELHIYELAAHGFFNDTNKSGYDIRAASDSWPRAIAFFRKLITN